MTWKEFFIFLSIIIVKERAMRVMTHFQNIPLFLNIKQHDIRKHFERGFSEKVLNYSSEESGIHCITATLLPPPSRFLFIIMYYVQSTKLVMNEKVL